MGNKKIISEELTNFIRLRKTLCIRIPAKMHNDSNFPFSETSELKIKMLKNKIIIEQK